MCVAEGSTLNATSAEGLVYDAEAEAPRASKGAEQGYHALIALPEGIRRVGRCPTCACMRVCEHLAP